LKTNDSEKALTVLERARQSVNMRGCNEQSTEEQLAVVKLFSNFVATLVDQPLGLFFPFLLSSLPPSPPFSFLFLLFLTFFSLDYDSIKPQLSIVFEDLHAFCKHLKSTKNQAANQPVLSKLSMA